MRVVKVNEDAIENILSDLLKRSPNHYDEYQQSVDEIVENVKKNGDQAVFDYTERFDGAKIDKDNILVTEEEIQEAYEQVDDA